MPRATNRINFYWVLICVILDHYFNKKKVFCWCLWLCGGLNKINKIKIFVLNIKTIVRKKKSNHMFCKITCVCACLRLSSNSLSSLLLLFVLPKNHHLCLLLSLPQNCSHNQIATILRPLLLGSSFFSPTITPTPRLLYHLCPTFIRVPPTHLSEHFPSYFHVI